ncbi:MAG TPA: TPM domain-containing protein [Clostridia bacterium]|nr:TPM domain-containing protein [Clostridia bacterium]
MRKVSLLIAWLLVLGLAGAALAAPPVPPAPNPAQPVNDFAGMLDREHAARMEQVATALKKATGTDLVVVTVENLGGYPIEEYALELFRSWGLGDKEKNNGVLLLVNQENALAGRSGRVRIEVGYGLEGAIPDGKAGRILDEYVLPAWDKERYSEGIFQGYMALAAAIAEEYDLDLSQNQALADLGDYQTAPEEELSLGTLIFILVLLLILWSLSRQHGGRRPPYRRSFYDDHHWGGPFTGGGGFGRGGFGGGGFGGFGGGSSGGGGASR